MKFLFKSFLLFAIGGISLLIVLNISHVTAISNGTPTCPDYEIIFARGSGQEINDTDYRNFKKAIDQKLANTNIKYSFYELGERKTSGSYPAISVAKFKTALGVYLDVGDSYKFKSSVEQGAIELLSRIAYYNKTCPSKKYILAGYSQGAMVITKSLTSINSSRIIYVANFGDPKLYLPEGKGLFPQAC